MPAQSYTTTSSLRPRPKGCEPISAVCKLRPEALEVHCLALPCKYVTTQGQGSVEELRGQLEGRYRFPLEGTSTQRIWGLRELSKELGAQLTGAGTRLQRLCPPLGTPP